MYGVKPQRVHSVASSEDSVGALKNCPEETVDFFGNSLKISSKSSADWRARTFEQFWAIVWSGVGKVKVLMS